MEEGGEVESVRVRKRRRGVGRKEGVRERGSEERKDVGEKGEEGWEASKEGREKSR